VGKNWVIVRFMGWMTMRVDRSMMMKMMMTPPRPRCSRDPSRAEPIKSVLERERYDDDYIQVVGGGGSVVGGSMMTLIDLVQVRRGIKC